MASDNSYVNALLGAAVSVVLSFLPFSPVVGGAVAGYLEGSDGARLGALAGVFAAIPMFGLFFLVGGALFAFLGFGEAALGSLAVAFAVVLLVAAYSLALSTVGGMLGVYLRDEFGDDVERLR